MHQRAGRAALKFSDTFKPDIEKAVVEAVRQSNSRRPTRTDGVGAERLQISMELERCHAKFIRVAGNFLDVLHRIHCEGVKEIDKGIFLTHLFPEWERVRPGNDVLRDREFFERLTHSRNAYDAAHGGHATGRCARRFCLKIYIDGVFSAWVTMGINQPWD